MKKSVQLYDAGLEEYPLRDVILSNIAFAALLAAGTIVCWLVSPAFGVAYLVVFAALTYGLLRRLTCTRCYYHGKRCGSGWGLLSAMCFGRRPLEEFNESPGVKLAPLVYGLMMLVPLIALAVMPRPLCWFCWHSCLRWRSTAPARGGVARARSAR